MKHEKKRYYRKTTIFLSVLLALFCAIFAFLTFWWFGKSYPAFDKIAKKGASIPGLSEGLSPQGLCSLPESEEYDFLMSGYIEGKPSRVYLLKEGEGSAPYVTFTQDGKAIESHFGGIACTEKYAYIASEEEVLVAPLGKILQGEGSVEIEGSFKTGFHENATCCVFDGMLYVAEFYHPPKYPTDPSHAVETANGVRHTLAYAYALDGASAYRIADMVPRKVLSVPDEAQGVLILEKDIYFSCSYGLPSSRLIRCDNQLGENTEKTFNVNGAEIPLYIVEGETVLTMPCMSEEICERDGRLHILFESSSKKYFFFVRTRISHFISLELAALNG